MTAAISLFTRGEATYSPCKKYRYTLTRPLDAIGPNVLFVMLNPSTATEETNDPTISRCIGYATRWGAKELRIGNVYALRSTDPKGLRCDDPVGLDNDRALIGLGCWADIIICAWGNGVPGIGFGERIRTVVSNLQPSKLHALKINEKSGQPAHPLYLRGDLKPQKWAPDIEAELRRQRGEK